MSGFLAIFRREFEGRRLILVAAALASLIPLLLPFFRRMAEGEIAESRGWMAFVVSAGFAYGLATALGSSMLAPRIATRRIAFDFARPVSGAAIWLGSLAAAVALAFSTAAIVWIPALLVGARLNKADVLSDRWGWALAVLLFVATLPVTFSLIHAIGLIHRSRSILLAFDALMWILCIVGTLTMASRLPNFFAHGPRTACLLFLAAAAAVGLLAAGQASVTRGRIDARAAHFALSTTLWSLIFGAVLVGNLYAAWVMAARPQSLRTATEGFSVIPAATGPWVQLSGSARGADARFLFDTVGGRFTRAQTFDWRGPQISRDGTRAAWVEGSDGRGPSTIRYWRLDDPNSSPVVTRIPGTTALFELSADGSRIATWENGDLSVHDLDAQRTLASARLPVGENERVSGVFVGRDVFRVHREGTASIDLFDLDVAHRTLTALGRIAGLKAVQWSLTNPDGTRILAESGSPRSVQLFDGKSGTLLSTLGEARAEGRWPTFLRDGRIALVQRLATSGLEIFGPDGRAEAEIALPPTRHVYFGGEVAAGQLVLGVAGEGIRYSSYLADLERKTVRKIADDLSPISLGRIMPEVGSEATKLFYEADQRSLVRLDPLTGQRRTLIGAP
jgi:hypothetical protein